MARNDPFVFSVGAMTRSRRRLIRELGSQTSSRCSILSFCIRRRGRMKRRAPYKLKSGFTGLNAETLRQTTIEMKLAPSPAWLAISDPIHQAAVIFGIIIGDCELVGCAEENTQLPCRGGDGAIDERRCGVWLLVRLILRLGGCLGCLVCLHRRSSPECHCRQRVSRMTRPVVQRAH